MTVIVILSLGLLFSWFLTYAESGNICQKNFTCVPISQCKIGLGEGDLLYPCEFYKHVCCPKTKSHEKYTSTEHLNVIKPLISDKDDDTNGKVNNTKINRISEYDKDNSDFNFQYENETRPPFLSNYNKDKNPSVNNKNKGSTNVIDSNGNPNKNIEKNISKVPQISTIEKKSDGIRINLSDYNSNINVGNHSSYKLQNVTNKGSVSSIVTRREPFQKNCGLATADNKITGGQVADPGQFPWMALLGFKQEGVDVIQFLCGGSLITDKHILTAAHCIIENRPWQLVLVRLGEYNLATARDCVRFHNDESCIDPHVDVPVNRIFVHPGYNKKTLKDDIAIIWMKRKVRESDFIRTVCLPFDRDFSRVNMTGQNFTVTGWGKTSSVKLFGSDILQYAKVSAWDQERCNNSIPPEVQPISSKQICANGPNSQDACKGDSGGPLVNTTLDADFEIRTVQIGIVSFGTSTCGDRNLPTVYTRVDKYLDWIVENVI